MKRTASISEILRPLKDAPFQAYLSTAVQVADILEWILEQTGTAEVWQTSFSISEEFLRRLVFLKKKRPISRFNLLLDHKATNKTVKLWSFIVQVVDRTFLADNHSKVLLVTIEKQYDSQHPQSNSRQKNRLFFGFPYFFHIHILPNLPAAQTQ